jgi:ABC-type transport system involved in multi-copper enzyme maturation permease subunit
LFISTRGHLDHLYAVYSRAQAACAANANCPGVNINLSELDRLLELIGTALVVVPALAGLFWGAPLIAREFENGTHRLAWTQSITRTRWLATKLAVVGTVSVLVTAVLSLLVTWWSSPIDRAHQDRFGSGLFGERNVVPLAYAAFGFALGALAGTIIRRTIPAMATTMVAFLAVRLAFTYAVRPHLLTPRHDALAIDPATMGFSSTNGGPATLMPNPPDIPNAWIYSTHILDMTGHGLTAQVVASSCPTLVQISGPPVGSGPRIQTAVPASVQNALQQCVTKIGASYHEVLTYQPANRYWPMQWIETAIYLAVALALLGCCFWWIRNRTR